MHEGLVIIYSVTELKRLIGGTSQEKVREHSAYEKNLLLDPARMADRQELQ
jgi:hypothetical protein